MHTLEVKEVVQDTAKEYQLYAEYVQASGSIELPLGRTTKSGKKGLLEGYDQVEVNLSSNDPIIEFVGEEMFIIYPSKVDRVRVFFKEEETLYEVTGGNACGVTNKIGDRLTREQLANGPVSYGVQILLDHGDGTWNQLDIMPPMSAIGIPRR